MNEHENPEQQLAANAAAVTPPPFHQSEEAIPGQEPSASPTLAARVKAMGLDEDTTQRLTQLTQGIGPADLSDDLLTTLARGITHDNDVQNADATGYLRGRNEKIEAVMHPQPQDEDDEHNATPVFPRYCRRSIWD
jgi:hypothetical protein